jgi:hypothetical protein
MTQGRLPVLEDGHGYCVTAEALDFLRVSVEAAEACRRKQRPLGMTSVQYDQFRDSLFAALARDGVRECDVRLQGSSARFFSGGHKAMPWDRHEIVEQFRRGRRRLPEAFEVDAAQAAMGQVWPEGFPRPHRRPFDAMHRLGLEEHPSDYDLQLSSDEIVDRAKERIVTLGIPADQLTVHSATYAFVRKDLVEDVCPMIHIWSMRQSDILLRNVTVAVFPSSGPPDTGTALSSHFRADDWMIKGAVGHV